MFQLIRMLHAVIIVLVMDVEERSFGVCYVAKCFEFFIPCLWFARSTNVEGFIFRPLFIQINLHIFIVLVAIRKFSFSIIMLSLKYF